MKGAGGVSRMKATWKEQVKMKLNFAIVNTTCAGIVPENRGVGRGSLPGVLHHEVSGQVYRRRDPDRRTSGF